MGKASLTIAIGGEYQGRDAIRKAEAGLRSLREAARQAGGGSSHIMSLGDSLVDIGSMMEVSGQKLEAFGAKMTKLTAPIAAVGAASVKLAADYQDSVAKVYTIMDKTAVSTEKMSKDILDLSTATGKSADELANATYQALSASVSTEKAAGFVADAVKLSKVGFTDTATAVDTLTTVINAYGYSADDAAMITGRLVQTQNKGKTTVNELAQSMGNVIPTASAYNVSLDNLCSAYVIMTRQGINTANATTALNGMLTELANEGSTVAGILKDKTGKSFGQLMAEGMDLGQVLQLLNESVDGDSEAFANLWGNVRASKGALAIANAGASEFTAAMGDMANSAGLVDDALSDLETPAAKARRAINAVKNTGIELGEEIIGATLPSLERLGGAAQDLYKWFGDLDDGTKQNIVRFGALAVATGPVMMLFGKGMQVVGGFVTSVGKGVQTIGTFTAAMKTAETQMKAAGATSVSMGAKMRAAAESTGILTKASQLLKGSLAMIGITAAVTAVGILVDKFSQWQEHTKMVDSATRGLEATAASAKAGLEGYAASADVASKSLGAVKVSADDALSSQAALAEKMGQTFDEVGTNSALVERYAETIEELGNKGSITEDDLGKLQVAVDGFNQITGSSIEVTDTLTGELNTSATAIRGVAEAYREEARAAAAKEMLIELNAQQLRDEMALKTAKDQLAAAEAEYQYQLENFPDGAAAYGQAVNEAARKVDELTSASESSKKAIDDLYSVVNEGQTHFKSLEDALDSCGMGIGDLGDLTDEELESMRSSFDGTLESIGRSCEDLGRDIPEGLAKGIKAKKKEPVEAAGSMVKEIVKRAKKEAESNSPSKVMQRLGSDMDEGLANGLKQNQSKPVNAAAQIVDLIKGKISGLPDLFKNTGSLSGQGLASSLSQGASAVSTSAAGLAKTAVDGISGTPGSYKTTGVSSGNSFAGGIGSVSAYSQGQTLANTGRSGLSSVGAGDLGRNFGNSFADGIMRASVWPAANWLASQARSAVSQALGIASPSKVGIELGGFFGEGIAIGIEESARMVEGASRSLSDTIQMAMTPSGTFAPVTAGQESYAPRQGAPVTMYVNISVNAATPEQGRAVGSSLASALYDEWSRREAVRL